MNLRREPLELVTRFFAYSEGYKSFTHDVDNFLDDFVKDHKDAFDEPKLSQEFEKNDALVQKYFPFGFAKSANATTTPRVRFEAIAVGTNLALRKKPDLVPTGVPLWTESQEFKEHTTTHGSNSATHSLAALNSFAISYWLGRHDVCGCDGRLRRAEIAKSSCSATSSLPLSSTQWHTSMREGRRYSRYRELGADAQRVFVPGPVQLSGSVYQEGF